ncbi:NAD(P)H-binding protein [Arsenicibacter rosenii]|uniref:NAD(P)-dependent oxidoreductase n=1 Tax=Arsenicibacter rosenii TaxID=1750698 RepID=A0A1S2VP70_9BACT|nr:NAD(P)H-binding protein [Arsenicibacter rosenii]OIN60045.1 NAD(P)-dependent oxidoreductase [Arsenicibacter rosenii]
MQTVSILGCGWLGLPLAKQLIQEGYAVKGSTTTPDKLPVLQAAGIDARLVQLNPEPAGDLTALLDTDILIVDIPPKAGKFGDDFHPEQIRHLAQAVGQSAVQRVIYISSTSVYPELNREVFETDVVLAEQSAAPALVTAEQTWLTMPGDRLVTVLRCGGLMGYERIPGKYVAGKTVSTGDVPVNYIHRDDAAGIITALLRTSLTGTFNVVAPIHPTRREVYEKSCTDLQVAMPSFTESAEPISFKLVSNQKLTNQLLYTYQYANPLNFFYSLP